MSGRMDQSMEKTILTAAAVPLGKLYLHDDDRRHLHEHHDHHGDHHGAYHDVSFYRDDRRGASFYHGGRRDDLLHEQELFFSFHLNN